MKKKLIKIIAVVLCVAVLASVAVVIACRNTDIPKLYFEGNIDRMYEKSDVRDIAFTYVDGDEEIKGYATVKIQGTSSMWYPKKNFTINFFADAEHNEKLKLDMGWGAQSKYCLKANWVDRTHARNVVSAKLVSQMQDKYGLLTEAPKNGDIPHNGTIDGFPVEIYSNGSFHGLYTFNIPKDEWQFAMDGDDPNHIVFCGEDFSEAGMLYALPNYEAWSIEVGEENEESLEKLSRLFDFVISSTDEEFRENFHQYMNLDAMLNYYVLVDFGYFADNISKNMLLVTYDGEIWYPSLYDLDTTWGADFNGKNVYDYRNVELDMHVSNLLRRVAEVFPQELAARYFELRQDVLTKENIMNEFNTFRSRIPWLTFAQEGVKWGTGLIRMNSDLPGFGYDQIEEYLDYAIPVKDAKYAAMQ